MPSAAPLSGSEKVPYVRQGGRTISVRAILFDCNGVIIDDEPIHLKLFQQVLKEEGIRLTRKAYFQKYLALDDRTCFENILKTHRLSVSKKRIDELIQRKADYYKKAIQKEFKIFPGVKSFIEKYQKQYLMAVVSGALRSEIDWILRKASLKKFFAVIVSAEDVKRSKPYPDCYTTALKRLRSIKNYSNLKAVECLAIEDSIHGVEAARRAGMKCLAITNSYSKKDLRKAEIVVKSLAGLNLEKLLQNKF